MLRVTSVVAPAGLAGPSSRSLAPLTISVPPLPLIAAVMAAAAGTARGAIGWLLDSEAIAGAAEVNCAVAVVAAGGARTNPPVADALLPSAALLVASRVPAVTVVVPV